MLRRLPAPAPEPAAALPPEDVVMIQLDLLQNNDLMAWNSGLRAAYAFASPASRAVSGPFEQFVSLLATAEYAPLVGFTKARLDPMIASRRKAYQRVHVQQHGGDWVTFLFILSCQQAPPYTGCWMTDSGDSRGPGEAVMVDYRPLDPARDYPAVAALMNLVSTVPVTADLLRQWAERADAGRARQQIVAVDDADQVIGIGDCVRDPWMPIGQFWADVLVDPAWRMQGIGAALYSISEAWAIANGALYLGDDVRGDQPEGRRFAENRGFKPVQHTFAYRVDLADFDADAQAARIGELEHTGYRFFSYDEAGDSRDHRKAIYKLNKRTIIDDWSFVGSHLPYLEFSKRTFEASWARADELMIAAKGELWVGFTQLADFPDSGTVVSVYTGVEREYRKQGLATALIALSFAHARSRGVEAARLSMDGRDETMQGIAARLGAASDAGAYRMVKTLPRRAALHGKN